MHYYHISIIILGIKSVLPLAYYNQISRIYIMTSVKFADIADIVDIVDIADFIDFADNKYSFLLKQSKYYFLNRYNYLYVIL